jgi:hypothetical protein
LLTIAKVVCASAFLSSQVIPEQSNTTITVSTKEDPKRAAAP